MKKFEANVGILKFADGSRIAWEFVEHVPYEPSAYHYDEGIIVATTSNTCYFISLGTGDVYAQADQDDAALTRLVENVRCPEIDKRIAVFEAQMRKAEMHEDRLF